MKLQSWTYLGLAGVVGAATLLPLTAANSAPTAPAATATAKYCPKAVAHRGGEGDVTNANENSMGAFNRAANIGVDVMETDVWFTKDKVPVIMHDATLDRTTDAKGNVSDYTWAQLKHGVRLNNGERIPSLHEALAYFAFRDVPSFIEYKDADDPQLYRIYLRTMKDYGVDAWAAGFSADMLEWMHAHDKNRDLMWFGLRSGSIPIPTTPADVPSGAQPGLINVLLSKETVASFTDAGYKMNVWYNTNTKGDNPTGTPGVPGDKGWATMTQAGVHWMSTDYPDHYKEWTIKTGLCQERPAKQSIQDCLTLPHKMKRGTTYTILPQGCMTSAEKKISVKVSANKSTAVMKRQQGATLLKVKNAGGKVTLRYQAPHRIWTTGNGNSWESYTSYRKSRTYHVKGSGGTHGKG